jgi:hypothetical protein
LGEQKLEVRGWRKDLIKVDPSFSRGFALTSAGIALGSPISARANAILICINLSPG